MQRTRLSAGSKSKNQKKDTTPKIPLRILGPQTKTPG